MTLLATMIRTRKGRKPARYPRRDVVDAILFLARTGCHVREGRAGPTLQRGLSKMAARQGLVLDIKAPPKGTIGFTPTAPLYRVEHAFARLGRWRRLSRCYEGSAASARAWLEVAADAYLLARLRAEPA